VPNAAHVLSDSGDEEYDVKDDERRSRQKVIKNNLDRNGRNMHLFKTFCKLGIRPR